MSKIVLLGGSGYVGSAFQKCLQLRGIDYESLTRSNVDYCNRDTLVKYLKETRPEFLINAAGYTGRPNVDACELDKANCLFGNAVLPGLIAEACADAGINWGHVSSGCIYTGTRADGMGFREDDMPNFTFRQNSCSFYSGTKGLGEEVLGSYSNVYTWRLRIPFNHVDHPRNYLTKILNYDQLLDATNSISHLDEFVNAAIDCWVKRVPFGIYNVTNPGAITTREIVELIEERGLSDKVFRFFESESEFMKKAAIAPRSNCVLDSSKLLKVGIELTPVFESVRRCLASWK